MKKSKVEHGKYPIDRPCSACGDGDYQMKYHDHDAPFRKGYGPAAALPESQPNGAFEQLRQIGAALGLDEETHGCDDLVEEVQRLKRMTESQPAPEMDYEKEAQELVEWQMATGNFITARASGQQAPIIPATLIIDWLRAHDARVQPSSVAEIERLRAALQEIAKGKGRFSMDPYEHAYNTIEDMKKLAESALKESSR